jgi:hypothetical protein
MLKVMLAFAAKGAVLVQVTAPVAPNVGVLPQVAVPLTGAVQFHPDGVGVHVSVVLACTYSVKEIAPAAAVLGPRFVSVWV